MTLIQCRSNAVCPVGTAFWICRAVLQEPRGVERLDLADERGAGNYFDDFDKAQECHFV